MARTWDTSDEGLERLSSVVSANPRSTAFVALAHALCDRGRGADAEDVCREGLGQHPRLVTGQVALGRSLFVAGRLREAQEVLIEATKASPEHADAFKWLAELLAAKGDKARARVLLEYAEELSPTDSRVAELLTEVGGQPAPRQTRPRTDFENTRVANARALAERMHEDPHVFSRGGGAGATAGAGARERPAGGDEDEPTVVATDAAALPWPPFADEDEPKAVAPTPPLLAPPPAVALSNGATIPDAVAPLARPAAPVAPPGRGRHRTSFWWTLGGVAGAVTIALGWMAAVRTSRPTPLPPGPQTSGGIDDRPGRLLEELDRGTLESLERALAVAAELAADPGGLQPETAARLGFASAFLAHDYGLASYLDRARAHITVAEKAKLSPVPKGSLAAARALVALEDGALDEATSHAARAVRAAPGRPESMLAQGRVLLLSGDAPGARAALGEEAAAAFPPTAIEAAEAALGSGDPSAAAALLEKTLTRGGRLLPAELLLANVHRLLGRPARVPERGCREIAKAATRLHAACGLATASEARLAGARSNAVRSAKAAAAQAGVHARLLARAALVLATSGEMDEAAKVVARAAKIAPKSADVSWAQAAVALGRGQTAEGGSFIDSPLTPEGRLVAARLAFANGGARAVAALAARVPAEVTTEDDELRALLDLGRGAGIDDAELKWLTRKADRGSPVAAYVLGRAARDKGDTKAAIRYLSRALSGHGDACQALGLLRGLPRPGKPAKVSKEIASLTRSLSADNGACVYLPKNEP